MTTDAETLKSESRLLRGTIGPELDADSSSFSGEAAGLLKFHGIYQQDDRDTRRARTRSKEALDHSCMVRVSLPAGRVTADQYRAMDDLATQVGEDSLRITTRQGIQYHFVAKGALRDLTRGLGASLLTTFAACGDVVRNVMVAPAPRPGIAHDELVATGRRIAAHIRPSTSAYVDLFIDGERAASVEDADGAGRAPGDRLGQDRVEEEPIYGPSYLPRKFKIGIAAPGDNSVDVFTHDVGLVPIVVDDRVVRWTVLVGGGLGMTHDKPETYPRLGSWLADVDPDDLIPTIEAIVIVQRDHGDRTDRKQARLKYLVDRWGLDRFRGEVQDVLGRDLDAPTRHRFARPVDHLGWHEQHDGGWYVGVHVPAGRIRDVDGRRHRTGLRAVVDAVGPEVRFTPQQNILLCGIGDHERATVERLLIEHGIPAVEELTPLERFAMACPALPTCSQALGEAERALPEVRRLVGGLLADLGLTDDPLHVRMTGCPNGCARPYATELGIVGRTKTAYDLFLGGSATGNRLGHRWARAVKLRDLPAVLEPVLRAWRDERRPDEGFGDFCHRIGVEHLPAALDAVAA